MESTIHRRLILALGACLLASAQVAAAAAVDHTVVLDDGTDVPLRVYRATGRVLVLWIASEHGQLPEEASIAAQLAETGIEVWTPDLVGARFLPETASSVERLAPADVAALIRAAVDSTGKTVFLFSSGRGAVPALRGARAWQADHPGDGRLAGAVLLSPNLYVVTPAPGTDVEFLPVARATNLPVFVMQSEFSPRRWWLDRLTAALMEGGSPVFVRLLRGVRGRFQFRPDAVAMEQDMAQRFRDRVRSALFLLASVQDLRREVPADAGAVPPPPVLPDRERKLKRYQGDPAPPPLALQRFGGGADALDDYRGQVVLVNFWASWCPPCRAEMPSMQRLQEHYAQRPFTILAVNMAEDDATVRGFLAETPVDFTVLMDRDGAALRDWRVFAFPTSFVLDAQGHIRFALFGSAEWDAPEVLEKIDVLLEEANRNHR